MTLVSDVFSGVVESLKTYQNAIRLKKLVFFNCRQDWPNDPQVLEDISWEDLIQELYDSHTNVEELSRSLYDSVNALTRSDVYANIAKYVINQMRTLYGDEGNTQMLVIKPSPITIHLPDKIVAEIEAKVSGYEQLERFKKLVYSIAYRRWENDLKVIQQAWLKNLLIEIKRQYTTQKELQNALEEVVGTLNRQNLYQAVADKIMVELAPIYNLPQEDTQLISNRKSSKKTISPPPPPPRMIPPEPVSNSKPASGSNHENTTDNESGTGEKDKKTYDHFDLRMDVMQYTNPLRAKVILFSVLHHKFTGDEEDWSMLKSCILDELLVRVCQQNRSIEELEMKICAAAKLLGNDEDSLQAAGVIVKSLSYFYETSH